MSDELSEFENRLFEWIRQSDFEKVPWSTKKAAKAFKVKEDEVYEAFAGLAPQVLAVHGNHDELADPKTLPRNVQILDGQVRNTAGLRVGGVSGIIGNPRRHQRRDEEGFLAVMESVTARRPHIILLHQGPEDAERHRRGDPGVTLSLATGYTGLTVFGHTHWDWPWLISLGQGQALNVDGRVVVLLRGDDHVCG